MVPSSPHTTERKKDKKKERRIPQTVRYNYFPNTKYMYTGV